MEKATNVNSVREALKKNEQELNEAFKRDFYGEKTTRSLMADTDIKCADDREIKVEAEAEEKEKELMEQVTTVTLPTNSFVHKKTTTVLVYNEDYINIVKNMFNTINIKVLKNLNLSLFRDIQERIRKHCDVIKPTFPRIEGIDKTRFGKPDRFIIGVTAISNTENCKSFNDVIQQNRKSIFKKLDVEVINDENVYIEEKCVCGQYNYLINMYAMENIETGLHLLIGSNCIDKWELATPQELKKSVLTQQIKKEVIQNKWINLVKKAVKKNNFYYMRSIFNQIKWGTKAIFCHDEDDWERKINPNYKRTKMPKEYPDEVEWEKYSDHKIDEKNENVLLSKKIVEIKKPIIEMSNEYDEKKIYLIISYDKRDIAKRYGAKFDSEKKRWYVMNNIAEILKPYKLVYLNNASYEQKDKVKELGAKWDNDARLWYCSKLDVDNNETLKKFV